MQGESLKTSDPQAMVSTQVGNVAAVIWDFETPEQKVKTDPSTPSWYPRTRPRRCRVQITHLAPNTAYHLQVHRVGYRANDAYSAYIDMGSPKELTAEQITHLTELTRDVPETDKVMQSGPAGTLEIAVPMNSNDVVLVKLSRGNK